MTLTLSARSRAVQLFVVLVALATAIALLPAFAAEAEASTDQAVSDHLSMMEGATSSSSTSNVTAFQAEESDASACFEDAPDDTQRLSDDTASNVPEADVLEHCVNFGPTLSLSLRVAQPTDPREDPNWNGATFAGWFLDIDNDDEGDYFVDYSLSRDGDLESTVHELPEEGDESNEANEVCTGGAAYTALEDDDHGYYAATHLERHCFGDATRVAVSAAMFYDTEGEGNEEDVHYDNHPEGGSFTGTINQADRDSGRLAGRDRMVTATEISKEQFPGGADVVYLARQDLFADAVAGGVLTDGPILLVPSCGTAPQEVRQEVDRLGPSEVIALGGVHAICDETLDETAGDRDTSRLSGATRIQTAVEISQREFADPDDARFVFLARADEFADAVTGGVLTTGPILLVNRCGEAHNDVQSEVDRIDPERVIALGGVHAICEETHDSATGPRDQQRLFGAGRIQTAVQISRFEFPNTTEDVYITRADLLADAVTGGVLTGGPILLVPSCIEEADHFPESVRDEISRTSPERLLALGGVHAVCDAVLTQAVNS